MSTGADCHVYEKEAGKWYYDLQRWPYGESQDYDTEGPFATYREATDHLHKHHANPGGYGITRLPGCKHDLLSKSALGEAMCDRCGAFPKSEK